MRLLLDTHTLIWWFTENPSLPNGVRNAIDDATNAKLVSAATAWEIATKHRTGKLPEVDDIARDIGAAIAGQGFEELSVTVADAARAGALPDIHRDPFDRMLTAQALLRDLVLVSNESLFDRYGARRLW